MARDCNSQRKEPIPQGAHLFERNFEAGFWTVCGAAISWRAKRADAAVIIYFLGEEKFIIGPSVERRLLIFSRHIFMPPTVIWFDVVHLVKIGSFFLGLVIQKYGS